MEEFLNKIKVMILKNIILFISLIISIISITSSVIYVNMNKCKPCKTKKVQKVNVQPNESKTEDIKYIKVDVKGAVNNPKVYTLEENSTVEDAINLAGGLKKDGVTSNINLSKKVKDEMVIYVFNKEEIKQEKINNEIVCEVPKCTCEKIEIKNDVNKNTTTSNSNNTNTTKAKNGKVSINTATKEELMNLNGVGENKAKNIIEYRETNGGFKSIEEIKNVNGIGESAFEKIKDDITI